MSACAGRPKVGTKGSADASTTPAVAGNALGAPARFYFSELQILTETAPESGCTEEQKKRDDLHEEWKIWLDEAGSLAASEDFKYFGVNVTLESMGFDASKYYFSVLDGRMPKLNPFNIRLRRTPGQILELTFLDQVVPMKLLTTPIYTFSATEKRGDCVIKHNVNVFTEKVGYFKKSEPK